jgi:hypothetical protein
LSRSLAASGHRGLLCSGKRKPCSARAAELLCWCVSQVSSLAQAGEVPGSRAPHRGLPRRRVTMESSRRLRSVGQMAIPRRIPFVDARDRDPAADCISSLSLMKFRQRPRGLRPPGSRTSPCRSRTPRSHPSRRPRLSGDLQRHREPTLPNRSPRAPSEGFEVSGARHLAPVHLHCWNSQYRRAKQILSMFRKT